MGTSLQRSRPKRKAVVWWSVCIAVLAAAITILGGCGGTPPPSVSAPSVSQQTPTASTSQPKATAGAASSSQASAGQPGASDRVQKNEAASVTIQATWPTQQTSGDSLRFEISMDTHSVNLDQFDLTKLSVLSNDKGQQVTPTAWEGPPGGGHHRSGTLVFPSTADGKPLIGSGTSYVELTFRDIAGVQSRVLRWNLSTKP